MILFRDGQVPHPRGDDSRPIVDVNGSNQVGSWKKGMELIGYLFGAAHLYKVIMNDGYSHGFSIGLRGRLSEGVFDAPAKTDVISAL